MSFLRGLFGRDPRPSEPTAAPVTEWDPQALERRRAQVYRFARSRNTEVVGESHHRDRLERLAGGRNEQGVNRADGHMAVLVREPGNPADRNAIIVWIMGAGHVGYLSREDALAFAPVIDRLAAAGWLVGCEATLTGGWDRGKRDRGSIGVMLGLPTPGAAMKELDKEWAQDRT